MTRFQQKSDEMFVSRFFIERLNKHYRLDYFPEENKNEYDDNSFIDSFAKSKSEKHPLIKMQLTTCDDMHYFLNKDWKDLEKGKEIEAPLAARRRTGTELVNLINTALSKKTCKKDEILVLHNDFAIEIRPFEKDLINTYLLPLVKENSYRGIFLVVIPTHLRSISSFRHEGQVVALKNIFGVDGDIF